MCLRESTCRRARVLKVIGAACASPPRVCGIASRASLAHPLARSLARSLVSWHCLMRSLQASSACWPFLAKAPAALQTARVNGSNISKRSPRKASRAELRPSQKHQRRTTSPRHCPRRRRQLHRLPPPAWRSRSARRSLNRRENRGISRASPTPWLPSKARGGRVELGSRRAAARAAWGPTWSEQKGYSHNTIVLWPV